MRHTFNFVYFKLTYSFFIGKPAKLFETTHSDWAPSLHLGNEYYISSKNSSTAATERYERSVKRNVFADTNSPPNVPLKKKITDEDTDDNTNNCKVLKSSL